MTSAPRATPRPQRRSTCSGRQRKQPPHTTHSPNEPGAALSPKLEAFLQAGPPPVFVGFGSMSDPKPARTARAIAEGARLAKQRVVVSRGWAGFELADDELVCVVNEEPHHLLFPRCAAVVHRGGIGTTHAAARAGVPQAVLPHLLDQFYTAHPVLRAGEALEAHRGDAWLDPGMKRLRRPRLDGIDVGEALVPVAAAEIDLDGRWLS